MASKERAKHVLLREGKVTEFVGYAGYPELVGMDLTKTV